MQKIAALLLLTCFISSVDLFLARKSSMAFAAVTWPDKPLTFVVAFGTGGAIDTTARRVAKYMEKECGVTVNVVNRPGAGGLVGSTYYMGLPDDGYSILFGNQILFSSSIVLKNASYGIDDISLLSFLYIDPECISVRQDSPYRTFADLQAAIKAAPGTVRMATTSGSVIQALHKNLREQLELDFRSVYFDSTTEKQAALLGGHIDVNAGGVVTALRNGDRVLLVMGSERAVELPDVPTVNEILQKPINLGGTTIFLAVKRSMKEKHPDRFAWLLEAFEKTIDTPGYRQEAKEAGMENKTIWLGPEKSDLMNREIHAAVEEYKDVLEGQ